MNQRLGAKVGKSWKAKMAKVFGERIQEFSVELQEILLDDIVTVFEKRLIVFNRANVN